MHYLYRSYTDDYRFTVPQLAGELGVECRTREARAALRARCLELGARHVGGGRVNLAEGGERMKDSIYSVQDWDAFLAALGSQEVAAVRQGPLPEVPTASRKARAGEVRRARLDRIEKKLDRILAILADER